MKSLQAVRFYTGFVFFLAVVLVSSCDGTDESSQRDLTSSDSIDGDISDEDGMTPETDTDTMDTDVGDDGEEPSCDIPALPELATESLAPNHSFQSPVYVTQAPGDDSAFFVVEQRGTIQVVVDGEVRDEPFLDIRSNVTTRGNEQGLLGLAFHPDYQQNGRFFINYTPDESPDKNVVAEYERDGEATYRASNTEIRRLAETVDPESNHNGGMVAFGPDGYLYAAFGDGGGAGDQHGEIGNGQNKETVLGSILRLDVNAPENDFVPEDNPFVGQEGNDKIWAYGLRNPWRFSFDRETGDLYIGDVGQNEFEEINFERASNEGGENYGWRAYEANSVYDSDLTGRVENHHAPIVEIPHGATDIPLSQSQQCASLTGGFVYRGSEIEDLRGYYLYGGFCTDSIAAFYECNGEPKNHQRVDDLSIQRGVTSFGESNAGELFIVYRSGEILKIVEEN